MNNTVNRYSDAELEEFRHLIEKKLAKTRKELEGLTAQILETTENSGDDFGIDWMDDSSISSDLDMLNDMAIRQRKFIKDLENALVRIKNKSYGICVITGELIDKKRLMAVPTTTKSLAAKITEQSQGPRPSVQAVEQEEDEAEEDAPKKPAPPKEPKIITRIIRKPNPAQPPVSQVPDDEEDIDIPLEDDDYEEGEDDSYVDPDSIASEDDHFEL